MSDFLLTQIINYGASAFAILLFLGALGIPVGASVLVIAAGAFSQQGILNWPLAAVVGFLAAVLGDAISFGIGYHAKHWLDERLGRSSGWKNAQKTFDARAGLAIYLTRFVVTSLAVPINLIAGGSGIKFRRFMIYDSLGELTWIILYGGLGYWFGSEWELVSDFISNFGGLILGILVLGIGIWLGLRKWRSTENETTDEKIPEA
jgi:membrane protein DedA with SNARE-associated domain